MFAGDRPNGSPDGQLRADQWFIIEDLDAAFGDQHSALTDATAGQISGDHYIMQKARLSRDFWHVQRQTGTGCSQPFHLTFGHFRHKNLLPISRETQIGRARAVKH